MSLYLSRFEAWILRKLGKKAPPEIQSELIDRLSHEIRTSLTGIVGYAEYLETGSTDPLMNFTARIIRESSQGLTRTTQSFFDYYLLSQRQIRLTCSRFVLSEVVCDVVANHQSLAADREVSFGFSCADNALDVVVSSDLGRMLQVLNALVFGILQNSEKWSMVQVHLAMDETRQELVISFVSSGVLVSPVQIHLQNLFWNSPGYQFRLQEGPGVEFALAKAMIQFLEGQVEFEHSIEFPSRLLVSFPASRHAWFKGVL